MVPSISSCFRSATWTFALLVLAAPAIGATAWFEPLTEARLTLLPLEQQEAWRTYLTRSAQTMAADKAALAAEVERAGLREPILAPRASDFGVRLDQPAAWFRSAEGRSVIATIVSYQTPAGGWAKHVDLGQQPRPQGGRYSSDRSWSYIGTFDNDATISQMRALARAVHATGDDAARASFLRALEYVLAAQYPNGGWPQVYPLMGGYHDAITYNDDAMINVLKLLRDIAGRTSEFAFVSDAARLLAADAIRRGVACLLATQVVVDAKPTVWGQQHDALTLAPTGARNFEPTSLCTAESASILSFLMEEPEQTPAVIAAIQGAVAWFNATVIHGFEWIETDNERKLVPKQNGVLWARFYEIGTNRPLFGDRDRSVHYDVQAISAERRNGYSWYGKWPVRPLESHVYWHVKHFVPQTGPQPQAR